MIFEFKQKSVLPATDGLNNIFFQLQDSYLEKPVMKLLNKWEF